MKFFINNSRFLLLPFVILLVSCSHSLLNLDDAKKNVIEYYEGGSYSEDVRKVIRKAINEFENISFEEKTAVVFDVDETVLSNYPIMKELDFGYIPHLWDEWENRAEAAAITEVKELYDFLVNKGASIIFLTGRKYHSYESTRLNLINEGYSHFDTLITRRPDEAGLTAIEYKTRKRTELVQRGYYIVGTVGDQHSDLDGSYSGIRVKIPNYFYRIK